LPEDERRFVFHAALLHDVGKADTTKQDEDGRWTFRGHSLKGTRLARRHLWQQGHPFWEREQIVNLVRYHQVPYWILERDEPERLARQVSLNVRCDHLAILAVADAVGRIAHDQNQLLDSINLFEELTDSLGCHSAPAHFASDHGRFLYFRERWAVPELAPHDDCKSCVTVMSGLPGAGKDHWIQRHRSDWPVVSLDEIRDESGVLPSKGQGGVVQQAREAARQHLRANRSFVWNATNVSMRLRRQIVDLATSYRARVEIVYVETSADRLAQQNRSRSDVVPSKVLDNLSNHRWDVPDPWEAQHVQTVIAP
jgi:predicted kinase